MNCQLSSGSPILNSNHIPGTIDSNMGGNVWSVLKGGACGYVTGTVVGAGAGAAICAVGYEAGAAAGETMAYTEGDAVSIGALGGAAGGGVVGVGLSVIAAKGSRVLDYDPVTIV